MRTGGSGNFGSAFHRSGGNGFFLHLQEQSVSKTWTEFLIRRISIHKCSEDRCYSPLACAVLGYCRELNVPTDPIDEDDARPKELIDECRAEAKTYSQAQ